MPKAILNINDDFVFRFSKNTVGSEETIREIPEFVKQHFVNHSASRLQLVNEVFLEQNQSGAKSIINAETSPLYLAEVSMSFSGKKIGGTKYSPNYTADSKLKINSIEQIGEDDQDYLLKINVEAILHWDFKSGHLNKLTKSLERYEVTWEESKVEIRINFRKNFLVADTFVYGSDGHKLTNQPFESNNGKLIGKPEYESNLGFIMEIMPNVFSVINSTNPVSEFEKNNPYYQKIDDKNIHMTCKFLNF